jgi:hypothetical protein
MKTNYSNKLMLAAAVIIMLNVSSCGKYDDGPEFSLRTKKARLTGEWQVVKVAGETPDGELTFEFEKNGDFTAKYKYSGYSQNITGDWEWDNKKEGVTITIGSTSEDWEIKRLTNKEFWFEDESNDLYKCEKN